MSVIVAFSRSITITIVLRQIFPKLGVLHTLSKKINLFFNHPYVMSLCHFYIEYNNDYRSLHTYRMDIEVCHAIYSKATSIHRRIGASSWSIWADLNFWRVSFLCIAIEIARLEKKRSNISDVRRPLIELFAFQYARNDPCKAVPFISVDEPSSNSCLFAYPLNVCKRWREYISRRPHADRGEPHCAPGFASYTLI